MLAWQSFTLTIFGAASLLLSIKGFYESHKRHNAFGEVHTGPLGAYVWGDAAILGLFWFLVAIFTLTTLDWVLFWLVFSVFWTVRSFGETIYWLNEQHAAKKRVNIKQKLMYKYFHNDSVLFIYQLTQQCIAVVSIVASIYFGALWLS